MMMMGARQRAGVNKENADRRPCQLSLLGAMPSQLKYSVKGVIQSRIQQSGFEDMMTFK